MGATDAATDAASAKAEDTSEMPDMESMSLLDRLAAEYEAEAAVKEAPTTEVAAGGKKNKNKKRKKGKGGQDSAGSKVEVVSAPAATAEDDDDEDMADNAEAEMLKQMGLPTGFG